MFRLDAAYCDDPHAVCTSTSTWMPGWVEFTTAEFVCSVTPLRHKPHRCAVPFECGGVSPAPLHTGHTRCAAKRMWKSQKRGPSGRCWPAGTVLHHHVIDG